MLFFGVWCSISKRMKREPRDLSLHYVSFIEERCGLMIELQMQFAWHVSIHHLGMPFGFGTVHVYFQLYGLSKFVIAFEFFRIMIAALSFLLDYEKIEDDDSDDSDASSSEDDSNPQISQVALGKEAIYKVSCILLLVVTSLQIYLWYIYLP